jgi:hypothetical protein
VQSSGELVEALTSLYERTSAGAVDEFEATMSRHPATMICGTAPGEVVRDREQLRFAFETEGVTLTAGSSPEAHVDGDLGYAFDEPWFGFPDGSGMRVRLTAVFIREDGVWKLVHAHFSSGVPDEEVVALQKRWGIQ